MSEEQEEYKADAPLVPIEQRVVDFYGDDVTAVLVEVDGRQEIYVPLRPICEYLGLEWRAQRVRLNRDPDVASEVRFIRVTRTDVGEGGIVTIPPSEKRTSGGAQAAMCLPVEMLGGWLFGVEPTRVRPELRSKVSRYRKECFRVLWRAFQGNTLPATSIQTTSDTIAALEQTAAMGRAITQMAEQQIEHERRIAATEDRLDRGLKRTAEVLGDFRDRLAIVEERTAPESFISAAQAGQIHGHIKALAEHIAKRHTDIPNPYGGIYTVIFRRFRAGSIERIRKGQFEEVMAMLEGWRIAADTDRQLGLFDAPGGTDS